MLLHTLPPLNHTQPGSWRGIPSFLITFVILCNSYKEKDIIYPAPLTARFSRFSTHALKHEQSLIRSWPRRSVNFGGYVPSPSFPEWSRQAGRLNPEAWFANPTLSTAAMRLTARLSRLPLQSPGLLSETLVNQRLLLVIPAQRRPGLHFDTTRDVAFRWPWYSLLSHALDPPVGKPGFMPSSGSPHPLSPPILVPGSAHAGVDVRVASPGSPLKVPCLFPGCAVGVASSSPWRPGLPGFHLPETLRALPFHSRPRGRLKSYRS